VLSGNGDPAVVIIGAMKSATTTLHHYLAQHPRICTSPHKELDFFSHDDVWERGLDWYRSQFEPILGDQLLLDSSPNYTKRHHWPLAAARLYEVNPNAKLIYLIREPVARTVSAYSHELAAGREHRAVSDVLADHHNTSVQTSRYSWQLEPYLQLFAPDQISVVRFDRLIDAPKRTVEDLFGFIGIDTIEGLVDEVATHNASAEKTMPTRLARMLRFAKARGALRWIRPRLADRVLPDLELTPETAMSIRQYLRPDLLELQRTRLADVSDWIGATHP